MPNSWIEHVKQYAKENNMKYNDALKEAKKTYKKSSATKKPATKKPAKKGAKKTAKKKVSLKKKSKMQKEIDDVM